MKAKNKIIQEKNHIIQKVLADCFRRGLVHNFDSIYFYEDGFVVNFSPTVDGGIPWSDYYTLYGGNGFLGSVSRNEL